jgi:hypothetical protein
MMLRTLKDFRDLILLAIGIAVMAVVTVSCQQSEQAATNAARVLANAAAQVQQICQAAAPLVQQAQNSTKIASNPTTQNLMAYVNASCTASGAVVPVLASNVTPTTPTWLHDLLVALQVAGQLAPVVLPVVAAL